MWPEKQESVAWGRRRRAVQAQGAERGSEKDEEAGRVCAGRGVLPWPDCRVVGVSGLCGALGVPLSMKHRPSPSA